MQSWGAVRAAAVVVMVGAWLGMGGAATAIVSPVVTGDCDALLVDAADQLSPAEEGEVEATAAQLRTDTSFEPRVWVLTQEQAGLGLATWIDLETAACPTWHAGSSDITSNFVVLAVTTDTPSLTGETYLWYGDSMPLAMNQEFPQIQADVINPALTAGDYARGLTDGLAAVGEVIDPPPPGPPIGWIVFGGIVVVGAAGFGGYRWSRARKARALARAELAKRFEAAAAGSDQAVLQLDPLAETIDSDIQLIRAGFHPEESEVQLAEVTGMLGTYATITAQRSDLVIARDQVLKDADDATLAKTVAAWEDLRGKSEELLPALQDEGAELAAVLQLPEAIPARVGAVPGAVDLVRAAERTARDLGFSPSSEIEPLASVPARVAEAERLAADRRYLAADAQLDGVESDLDASRVALTTLPERFEELTDRVEATVERRAALGARIDEARAAEANLTAQFHPAIAAEVAGSSTRASQDADRSDAALADARTALAARDLGRAATAVIAAEDGLGHAELGAAAPAAMLDRVRRLATELPTALAAARGTLEALRARAHQGTPAQAQVAALQARADAISLASTPDWPRLEVEIKAIQHESDELTEHLDSEARAEAQRQAAQEAERKRRRSSGGGMGFWGGGSSGSFGRSSGRSWSSGGSRSSSSSSHSSGSRGGGGGGRSSGGRSGGGSRR